MDPVPLFLWHCELHSDLRSVESDSTIRRGGSYAAAVRMPVELIICILWRVGYTAHYSYSTCFIDEIKLYCRLFKKHLHPI